MQTEGLYRQINNDGNKGGDYKRQNSPSRIFGRDGRRSYRINGLRSIAYLIRRVCRDIIPGPAFFELHQLQV